MDPQFTNAQILGRLRAELKGWRVDRSGRGDTFEVTAPDGRITRRRFDEVRTPLALQEAIASLRRPVGSARH